MLWFRILLKTNRLIFNPVSEMEPRESDSNSFFLIHSYIFLRLYYMNSP